MSHGPASAKAVMSTDHLLEEGDGAALLLLHASSFADRRRQRRSSLDMQEY